MTPASTASGEKRITSLDGLRGCAVLLVLVHHFIALHPNLLAPLGDWRSYLRSALLLPTASGVDLFFVLSGFLVGGILIDHQKSPNLFRSFYMRRFLRIVPLAWLFIFTMWVVGKLGWINCPEGLVGWWPYPTFTVNFSLANNNGWWVGGLTQLWSVAIEEQFYLMLPPVVRGWPAHRLVWLGPSLIAISWLSRMFVFVFFPDNLIWCHVLMPCRLDAFGLGLTAAWLVRSARWTHWPGQRRLLWSILALSGVLFAWLVKLHAPQAAHASWGYTVIAIFFAALLLLVQEPRETIVRRFFTAWPLLLYGRYSYFIYLFQWVAGAFLAALLFHGTVGLWPELNWLESFVVPLLILAPAWLSWRFFEAPLLRFGKRFAY